MKSITIPKADYGFSIPFIVLQPSGLPLNLTDMTITLKVWRPGMPEDLLVSGSCSIDVAASGTCHYVVTSTDFQVEGTFDAELELTQSGMRESVLPFQIIVSESG